MRAKAAVMSAALLVAASPAHSQQPGIEHQLLLANQDCLTQSDDPGVYPPETIIASCTTALPRLDAIQPVTEHDANVRHAMRAAAYGAIAGSYARQDQKRTRRTCERAEQAWSEAAQIRPALSPAAAAGFMRDMMASARGFARVCRQDFAGLVPNATPLD
jgi:hypothetical protein